MCDRIQFRLGTEQDIDELSALYDALNDYLQCHINYPGWRKGIYPTREDAEQGIGENDLYVAALEDRIAGTFILRHGPEKGCALADWKIRLEEDEVLVLHTLAVHPDFAHRGVGRQMLRFALDRAAGMKAKAVRLDVYEKNLPAIRLYEAMEFQYVDTVDLGYGMYGLDRFRLYQKLL